MRYPDRAIATYLQSPMPDSRAQGIELACILRGTTTQATEGFEYYIKQSGALMWSKDRQEIKHYAELWAKGMDQVYRKLKWEYGSEYIAAQRCIRMLHLAWGQTTQGLFFQCLSDAIAEAPNAERPALKVYRRYCELTLGGTTHRNRALRLAQALLAGDVQ